MNPCRICHAPAVAELRDFGPMPICNRFASSTTANEPTFPMVLGQCSRCGLIQMLRPVPPAELRTRLPWITYTEPTGHLDSLVTRVLALPGVTRDASVFGIFLPSDKTLDWFGAKGFKNTHRLDIRDDLGIDDPCAGTETIQDFLDAPTAERIASKRGRSDIVVMRHILEHTHDIAKLMSGLHALARPGGYVILEVPDCQMALENNDYTTLWEEHTSYFTAPTFAFCLQSHGWRIVHQERIGVSLLAIVQPASPTPIVPSYSITAEQDRAKSFAAAFPECRRRVNDFASDFSRRAGKIAVFGAGHLSCVFINLMDIKSSVVCVIDDHEKKQGMFMPGSRLPILSSRALLEQEIALCLSSLGAETDAKIVANNPAARDFVASGGKMRSILPGPNHFLSLQ